MKRSSPTPPSPHDLAQQVWLTEAQTAQRLNMSQKWLQAERLRGDGLPYAKFGKAIRYNLADIEAYELQCMRTSTSDAGPSVRGGR